ncbi:MULTISPECIES: site-specific integrase [unclassified Microbacterium]|uniref:tyrosine-type recombinase/integrase n=1 Tax=unclassified Microbacterium TaxID=2609290 RepID=UPI000EA88A9F|nr:MULTISPECIES: site-specific integrase [unclassified Microbacterium]MBT2485831.1 site-specific integrase [Microbacterium sp. ISL-108]RKN68592.1 site-specific integrase [Microbacterium sp. CGR2]
MASVSSRTLKSGEVRWRVQVRYKGRMKQTTFLEHKGAEDYKKLVERVGWEAAEQVRKSRMNRDAGTPTLREYTHRYLSPDSGLLTGVEKGTREGYEAVAERSWLQMLGDVPIDLITKPDVGSWLAWQERQPVWRDRHKPAADQKLVSAKTVRNYHALLSAVFKSAVEEGFRTDNPAFKMRVTRGVKRENVFLTPSELSTILHMLPARYQRVVLFLAGTGLRWGEMTALTWGDVNLHGNPPTVRVTRAWKKSKGAPVLSYPKSSKSRRSVSLSANVLGIMGEPGKSDEWVFPAPQGGHMWHGAFYTRVWRKAVADASDVERCRAMGLEPLRREPTVHDLRHTHASWLIAQGKPLPHIQARMGHESITTTVGVYGHLVPDAHEQMAMAIDVTLADVRMPLAITEHADS